jgi:hypothetical protein
MSSAKCRTSARVFLQQRFQRTQLAELHLVQHLALSLISQRAGFSLRPA